MPPLTVRRLLARGLLRRCPLCGAGGLFERWFRIRERCPRCNFPLERVEGHTVGSLGMNTVVTFAAMLVTVVTTFVATYPDPPVLLLTIVAMSVVLVVPPLPRP